MLGNLLDEVMALLEGLTMGLSNILSIDGTAYSAAPGVSDVFEQFMPLFYTTNLSGGLGPTLYDVSILLGQLL